MRGDERERLLCVWERLWAHRWRVNDDQLEVESIIRRPRSNASIPNLGRCLSLSLSHSHIHSPHNLPLSLSLSLSLTYNLCIWCLSLSPTHSLTYTNTLNTTNSKRSLLSQSPRSLDRRQLSKPVHAEVLPAQHKRLLSLWPPPLSLSLPLSTIFQIIRVCITLWFGELVTD